MKQLLRNFRQARREILIESDEHPALPSVTPCLHTTPYRPRPKSAGFRVTRALERPHEKMHVKFFKDKHPHQCGSYNLLNNENSDQNTLLVINTRN